MGEVLYGPWNVTVLSKEAWFDQRFIITGSVNADGVYPGIPGTGPGLVTGDEWTVSFEWNDNTSSGWQPSDVRHFARYTVTEGFVVELGADDNYEQFRDRDYNDMVLTCVNQDPALTPLHPVTPFYDFSVPQDILDKNPHPRPDVRRPDEEIKDDKPQPEKPNDDVRRSDRPPPAKPKRPPSAHGL